MPLESKMWFAVVLAGGEEDCTERVIFAFRDEAPADGDFRNQQRDFAVKQATTAFECWKVNTPSRRDLVQRDVLVYPPSPRTDVTLGGKNGKTDIVLDGDFWAAKARETPLYRVIVGARTVLDNASAAQAANEAYNRFASATDRRLFVTPFRPFDISVFRKAVGAMAVGPVNVGTLDDDALLTVTRLR